MERFGTAGTVVQFSTEFCSRCPGVRRLLSQRVDAVPSVEFVHLDLTHEPELAARFNVLPTPPILFIDAAGRPSARLSGQLDHKAIREAVDTFVDAAASSARLTASGPAVRTARSTSTSALTTGAVSYTHLDVYKRQTVLSLVLDELQQLDGALRPLRS